MTGGEPVRADGGDVSVHRLRTVAGYDQQRQSRGTDDPSHETERPAGAELWDGQCANGGQGHRSAGPRIVTAGHADEGISRDAGVVEPGRPPSRVRDLQIGRPTRLEIAADRLGFRGDFDPAVHGTGGHGRRQKKGHEEGEDVSVDHREHSHRVMARSAGV